MKTIIPVVFAAMLAVLSIGCRVRDVRSVELYVPEISNRSCISVAEVALRKLPDSPESSSSTNMCMQILSVSNGFLRVRYDSMKIGVKNIEWALAEAGFNTPTFKANQKAREMLPEACGLK